MAIRRLLSSLLPAPLKRTLRTQRERVRLATVPLLVCDGAGRLAPLLRADLQRMFAGSEALTQEWRDVTDHMTKLGITERAGGVNLGDRRALYYLIRQRAPRSVLEIGTHIGASTAHIAAAMQRARTGGHLTTVDICDVNDTSKQPWLQHGALHSPRAVIEQLEATSAVEFITQPSLQYLVGTTRTFDFIFLDGDHSASTVYREIPAALRVLNPNGLLLLHDIFPKLEPLWPDGGVIPGGWLAVQRLRREGAAIELLPLGELPWPTKQGSRTTSLALLVSPSRR